MAELVNWHLPIADLPMIDIQKCPSFIEKLVSSLTDLFQNGV